jgi:hypothetical protein
LLGVREHAPEFGWREFVNPFGPKAYPGVADYQVVHTEHLSRVLTYQVRAFAQ